MKIEELSDAQIIDRLTHVEIEVRKATWDYWIFKCDCGRTIRLEHLPFNGAARVGCDCGASILFNFAAVVKRWTGVPPKVSDHRL